MTNIELLAPAKDIECAKTAINCGADAVYIGAPKFGARSTAGNTIEDIENLITYAHKYYAKVYITINTILSDKEIFEAQKLIHRLYEIGADAIIIQDMGILELDLPPIPIFASTQTHNNNAEKVKFLQKVGFQRVILARELSLKEIKAIKSSTNIELESFIHGALCVCYSGQCYMSYAIGGRSGNRGECAQPCRKAYTLKDSSGKVLAKDKYLLSLKDLNLSESIENLIDAGISSFKIEGRLKDSSYIKNITSFYRQEIDKVLDNKGLKKASSGKSLIVFTTDPYKTFNRGYSDYFLNGRKKEIASFNSPKHVGEYIGKVISVNKNSFKIDGNKRLNPGDGITFYDENGELKGTGINSAEKNIIYPNSMEFISKNTVIYRNYDHNFHKTLDSQEIQRKIRVNFTFYEENNKVTQADKSLKTPILKYFVIASEAKQSKIKKRFGLPRRAFSPPRNDNRKLISTSGSLILKAVDEDGIKASKTLETSLEIAENKEMALDNVKKQLSKLGDTDFICENINIELENIYFIRIKELNELRRAVIEELAANRIKNYSIARHSGPDPESPLGCSRETAFLTSQAGHSASASNPQDRAMLNQVQHDSAIINSRIGTKTNKIQKNNFPYPEKILSYKGNVLNSLAKEFYTRHGVTQIEHAPESGLDMSGKVVMTTKHCLRYGFNLCKKHNSGAKIKEPLYLVDSHGKEYELKFNCKDCEMEVIF